MAEPASNTMESGPSHTTEWPLSFLTENPHSSMATPGSLTVSTDGPLGIPLLVSHLRPAHSITHSSLKPQSMRHLHLLCGRINWTHNTESLGLLHPRFCTLLPVTLNTVLKTYNGFGFILAEVILVASLALGFSSGHSLTEPVKAD